MSFNFRLTSEKEQRLAKIGLIAGPAIMGSVVGGLLYYAATGIRPARSGMPLWWVVPISAVMIGIAWGSRNLALRLTFAVFAATVIFVHLPVRGVAA